ncbi:MAG: PRC-barrel domain-containing protein [Acetobacteraceae bacterium]
MLKVTTAALLAASVALPVLAQTPAPPAHNNSGAAMTAPATKDTGTNPTAGGYNSPSARNSVMTDHGTMRTSKIVGSSVYNDKDEKIGSVDDVVIGSDNSLTAILSVGGFLGMGSKMVQVPFNKLQFGNTKESSDNRVVMPGMTKEALTSMPDYHYTNRG